ncbi:putative targeting protein for Xklp2 like protein [Blattamonas nauphoetae]|uniref:Targeting protein for Xklp2 like protein n=1 Tax=Blattamonas nauphoetae TaxID=2049346 RepID=A0ABQ9WVA4_9EUKA|nr:putative targeting protein for Xklp2 like protein [Blattamonas nauphoetae]
MTTQTIPHSPHLVSLTRTRPLQHLSFQDKENQIVEEMKRNQISALPFPTKIYSTQHPLGIPDPVVKSPTKGHSPRLLSQYRSRPLNEEPSEEPFVFRANPPPRELYEGPTGIPQRQQRPVTVPTPFTLETDARDEVEEARREEQLAEILEQEALMKSFHARSVPDFTNVMIPVFSQEPTEVVSFHLLTEERGDQYQTAFRQELEHRQAQEKELRQFQARPLVSSAPFVPQPSSEITESAPFHLSTEERGRKWESEMREKLETRARTESQRRIFKATPATVVHQTPFVPQPSSSRPTKHTFTRTRSDARAEERRKFDERMRQKEEERKRELEERELEKKRREEEEIRQLRKQMQFKARKIPKSCQRSSNGRFSRRPSSATDQSDPDATR